jgi:hypothetical protein
MFVVGLILVLVGAGWKSIAPPTMYWSEDQSREYTKAFAAVHAAEDSGGRVPSAEAAHQFTDAQQRFAEIKSDLEHARTLRDRTGTYFGAAGMAIMLATIAVYKYFAGPA